MRGGMRTAPLAALVSLTLACPGPKGGDDATSTSGDAVCPDHPVTDDCCCFESGEPSGGFTSNRCAAEPLCPTIMATCAEDGVIPDCPAGLLTTMSDAAITCALEALRDGAVGRIDWEIGGAQNPGQGGQQVSLALVTDGTAFRWGYDYFDLGADVLPAEHAALQPTQYFVDCLALTAAPERFVCLRGALGAAIEECVAGYPTEYF